MIIKQDKAPAWNKCRSAQFGVAPGAVSSLKFDDWVKQTDIKRNGLALRDFGKLRGVQANEDVEAGTVVLEVPADLCLSDGEELFAKTPIGQLVPREEWKDLFWLSKMAAVLAYERKKGADSKFCSWIQNLPVEHPPVPFDWNEEETSELQDDLLEAEIDGAFFWFGSRYDEIFFMAKDHGIEGKDLLTREQFLSAAFMIQSRTFLLEVNGQERRCMVPFMDMFNHKPGCQSHFSYNALTDKVELRLDYAVKKGEQIFINYGENSNGHFLKYYGFIPDENPYESVQFRGICNPEDLQHMNEEDFPLEKMSILEETVALNEVFNIYGSSIQQEYLSALRLALATREDYSTCLSQNWRNALHSNSAISSSNEKQVAEILLKRCKEHQLKFPTTIEDDEICIQNVASENIKLAAKYRLQKKQILENIISRLKSFLEQMELNTTNEILSLEQFLR